MLKVKIMHISAMNISKMATDMIKSTIVIKYQVRHRLSIFIFTFDVDQF